MCQAFIPSPLHLNLVEQTLDGYYTVVQMMMSNPNFSSQKAEQFMTSLCPVLNREDAKRVEEFDVPKVKELLVFAQMLQSEYGYSLSSFINFFNEVLFYFQKSKLVTFN